MPYRASASRRPAGVAGMVARVGLAWMRETPNRAATSVAGLVLEVRVFHDDQHGTRRWQLGALEWVFPKKPAIPPLPARAVRSFGCRLPLRRRHLRPHRRADNCKPRARSPGPAPPPTSGTRSRHDARVAVVPEPVWPLRGHELARPPLQPRLTRRRRRHPMIAGNRSVGRAEPRRGQSWLQAGCVRSVSARRTVSSPSRSRRLSRRVARARARRSRPGSRRRTRWRGLRGSDRVA